VSAEIDTSVLQIYLYCCALLVVLEFVLDMSRSVEELHRATFLSLGFFADEVCEGRVLQTDVYVILVSLLFVTCKVSLVIHMYIMSHQGSQLVLYGRWRPW